METPFESKSKIIRALLTDSDALYQIPDYQRPYKWGSEQVNQLWTDLEEAWENDPDGNYFLGSIITAKSSTHKHYVDVVDGQQRLTTLIILLCVIRDMYPEINKNSDDSVKISLIKDAIVSISDSSERLRFPQRLLTGDNAKSDFKHSIVNDGATKKVTAPMPKDLKGDKAKYKYDNSVMIFRKKLKELGPEKVEKFVDYLFYNVHVVKIECKTTSFAIKLFQVLNTRGLDLSTSDLIKSLLLEKISILNSKDEANLPRAQQQFVGDWRDIENMSDDCKILLDDVFTIYLYYTLAENPRRSMYDELSEAFNKQIKNGTSPEEIVCDIKRFVEKYKNDILKEDKMLYSFQYLPWKIHWRSILLTALQTDYPNFDELAKELRRFYYLYWIGGKTLVHVKLTSFQVIKKIKEQESINNIISFLREKTDKDEVVNDSIECLAADDMAEYGWAKTLLVLLEYEEKDDSMLSFVEVDSKIHLEHVYPQSPKSGWGHINKTVEEQYLYSAGNITLLSGKKNVGASNKPFADKIAYYKGQKGNSQGVTSFAITQRIISLYDNRTYDQKWTEAAMRDRRQWFLDGIAELLDIKEELAEYQKTNP